MVTWGPNTLIPITHYREIPKLDHSNMWYSRRQFFEMISKNYREILKEQHYQKNFQRCYQHRVNFRSFEYKQCYYRENYLGKIGLVRIKTRRDNFGIKSNLTAKQIKNKSDGWKQSLENFCQHLFSVKV